jgi:phosphatidate phosphatase APP1
VAGRWLDRADERSRARWPDRADERWPGAVAGLRGRLGRAALGVVLAAEDASQAALVAAVALLGRHRVAVLPFLGHGTPDRVHIRARVVLGAGGLPAPGERTPSRPATGARPVASHSQSGTATVGTCERRSAWRVLRASLGRFLTVELPGAPVTIRTPAGETRLRADREGYVDAAVEATGLGPGWQEVTLAAAWRSHRAEAVARVLVVAADARIAVISDVDDTVIETGLTRGLEFLRLTLLTEVAERTPLPGAAELYTALTRRPDGPPDPVFYLSTSPWNLHDLLTDFVTLRGFPAGPMLLTDWGPGHGAFLRVPAERHKLTLIRQVLADHPGLGVVLIGDTGQVDPEIYATVADEAPDRVRAIYIRRTGGLPPRRSAEVCELAARVTAAGVPMLAADDSIQIAEHAARIGLLQESAVSAVRTACSG